MNLQRIKFGRTQTALCTRLGDDLPGAINALGLSLPSPVIVLVGGAGGVDQTTMQLIHKVTHTLCQIAAKHQAILVDGGTRSGVMASIGQVRRESNFSFPLLGVVVESLARIPSQPGQVSKLRLWLSSSPLDPGHTHFLLVPGETWGDESEWIARTATHITGGAPSVTILINGGEISRQDLKNSLKENRPVIVVAGTGRLADELADGRLVASPAAGNQMNNSTDGSLIFIAHAQDDGSVFRVVDNIFLRR